VRRAPLLAGSLALFAPAVPAGANSNPPSLAVSAWPARVVVTAPGHAQVGVGNPGDEPVQLVARAQSYALDQRGRPRIQRPQTRWFVVRPARLVVPPHRVAQVQLTVRRPPGTRPGDHAELLLLATEPPAGRRVFARLRIGVVVVVRVPGRLVHRLGAGPLRVRRRAARTSLELTVANLGNVDEWLGRGRISVTLVQGGWRMPCMPIEARRLLARSSGIMEARFRRRLHGPAGALVVIRHPRPGVAIAQRRYHLRL
jgi:hypothetical protein